MNFCNIIGNNTTYFDKIKKTALAEKLQMQKLEQFVQVILNPEQPAMEDEDKVDNSGRVNNVGEWNKDIQQDKSS